MHEEEGPDVDPCSARVVFHTAHPATWAYLFSSTSSRKSAEVGFLVALLQQRAWKVHGVGSSSSLAAWE